MIKRAAILPTGDEIQAGVVLDTDSPEVMRQLVKRMPGLRVVRHEPIADEEAEICRVVQELSQTEDLIILIGGSGGGHRFSETLGWDYTHTALENVLSQQVSSQLFGKNGHLWCKLVCGKRNRALVVNLPGPFVEAKAAMEAFCRTMDTNDIAAINQAMAEAVIEQYPCGAEVR